MGVSRREVGVRVSGGGSRGRSDGFKYVRKGHLTRRRVMVKRIGRRRKGRKTIRWMIGRRIRRVIEGWKGPQRGRKMEEK